MYTKEVKKFLEATKDNAVFCFDTETTGLDAKSCDIIEFSAIEYRKNGEKYEKVRELDIYINPGYPLPEKIVEITGITDEKLAKDGISKHEAAEKIAAFWGANPNVLGYNSISFDHAFVNALYNKEFGKEFTPNAHLDVLKMARSKMPKPHKLIDMATAAGIADGINFHTSLDDALATFGVFEFLLPKFDFKEEEKPFVINAIRGWKMSDTLNRIYVNNSLNASVFYDVANGCWRIDDCLNETDIKAQIFAFSKTSSDEEFVEKYKV